MFWVARNGCLAAEALVLFGRHEILDTAERLRKRSGHLISKMRYVSAQLLTYLEEGLWLQLAGNANAHAARFAESVKSHPEAGLEYPVEANEVFVRWTPDGFEKIESAGSEFHMWPGRNDLARFVFSHCTTADETAALINGLKTA